MRSSAGVSPTFAASAPRPEDVDDGLGGPRRPGLVERDGYVYLADRHADIILTGGADVYPAEVEAAIGGHHGAVVRHGIARRGLGGGCSVVQPAGGVPRTNSGPPR